MRQYVRIEKKQPATQPHDKPKSAPRTTEVDFDIAHNDVADEFTIL